MVSLAKKLRGLVWLEHFKGRLGLDVCHLNTRYCLTEGGDASALPYKWRSGEVYPSPITAKRFAKSFPSSFEVYEYPIFELLGISKRRKIPTELIIDWLYQYKRRESSEEADFYFAGIIAGLENRSPEYIFSLRERELIKFSENYPLFAITAVLALVRDVTHPYFPSKWKRPLVGLAFELLPAIKNDKDFAPHYELLISAVSDFVK